MEKIATDPQIGNLLNPVRADDLAVVYRHLVQALEEVKVLQQFQVSGLLLAGDRRYTIHVNNVIDFRIRSLCHKSLLRACIKIVHSWVMGRGSTINAFTLFVANTC